MKEYRFYFMPNLEAMGTPFYGEPVSSKELAAGQLGVVAYYTLHLHETSLMPDHSNMGGIESREDGGEWEEVDEDDL